MSEASEFVPRQGLNRTLTYRAYIRGVYWLCWAGAALSFAASLAYLVYGQREQLPLDWRVVIAFLVLVPSLLALSAHFYWRQFIATTVHLKPDGITLVKPGGTIEFPFQDVQSVKVWHVPYLGGHFQFQMKDCKSPVFTVGLERCEYTLEALLAARPGILPMDQFLRIRRTALTIDHSWARITDRFRYDQRRLLALFLFVPLLGFLAMLPIFLPQGEEVDSIWKAALNILVSVFVLNATMGLAAWVAADSYLLYRMGSLLENFPDLVRRDLTIEKKTYRWASIGHLVLFVGCLMGFAISAYLP